MNLHSALADYLELRRGPGFSLNRDAKLLAQFLTYLEEQGSSTVTVAHALTWSSLPRTGSPSWLSFRMSVVRGFATYLRTLDPCTEVPPPGLLPGGPHRAVPYLYSDTDILALFTEAERLRTPMRTATIQTFIALMTVTGMRGGEVVALDDDDFDPVDGVLHVRHTSSASPGWCRCSACCTGRLAVLPAFRTRTRPPPVECLTPVRRHSPGRSADAVDRPPDRPASPPPS